MSNQQNNNVQLDDDVQEAQQQPLKYRPRNFYRQRPGRKIGFVLYLFEKYS
jgi:hypothetical protein